MYIMQSFLKLIMLHTHTNTWQSCSTLSYFYDDVKLIILRQLYPEQSILIRYNHKKCFRLPILPIFPYKYTDRMKAK